MRGQPSACADVLTWSRAEPVPWLKDGRDRIFSGLNTPTILAGFRLDLVSKQLSWGFSYRAAAENTFFFADEESSSALEVNRLRI